MPAPDFSEDTRVSLAARSCHICNNPQCATLTLGPADAVGTLAVKLGEAAHIAGARLGSARYDGSMTDEQRASPDNGMWLCANCHTMVDKNSGAGFPTAELVRWKTRHEEAIRSLLLSHRSPLPYLRRVTEEGQYAQDVIDALERRGAMFVEMAYEVPQHVDQSIDAIRSEIESIADRIRYDSELKNVLKDMGALCRGYMNTTGRYPQHRLDELRPLRNRIGVLLARLCTEYGCTVRGPLAQIIPGQSGAPAV